MSKKRNKKQESAGSSWMASYCDLVTVLFALFVMLYALSDIDEELWERFVLAAAFGTHQVSPFDYAAQGINELVGNGISILPDFTLSLIYFERPTINNNDGPERNQMAEVADDLRTYFAEANLAEQIIVEYEEGEGRITVIAHDGGYFDSGSANIRAASLPALEAIGNAIAVLPNVYVWVVGHTDNVPISTMRFPDNWELSTARANSVVRHFVYVLGVIEHDRITPAGHGEYRPIDTNLTPEGQQRNRRVEIILEQIN